MSSPEPDDYYIRNKKKFVKLSIVSSVLLAVFFVLAVTFFFISRNQHISYSTVQAEVYSVHSKAPLSKNDTNKVTVIYDGKTYNLINVKDSEISRYTSHYLLKTPANVYLTGGKMYSNVEGIRGHSVLGNIYFICLFGTMGLIMTIAVLIGCVVEAKKREKGIYPDKYFDKHGPF